MLLLIGVNCLVTFPALFHAPKTDHVLFLAEILDKENVKDMISHTYSYNRTREFQKGDEQLFRPLFFLTLILEKLIFGYDYFFWQLTGLILHLLVVWQLFKLLSSLKPGFLAFLSSLFFSVLTVSQSMVIWHHVHGYLLGILFCLCALNTLIEYIRSDQTKHSRLWLISLYLTLAILCYEMLVILCLLFIFVLFVNDLLTQRAPTQTRPSLLTRPRKKALVKHILFPVVFYTILYCLDLVIHGTNLMFAKVRGTSFLDFFISFNKILGRSILGPFMPFCIKMNPIKRLKIAWVDPPSWQQFFLENNISIRINVFLAAISLCFFFYILMIIIRNQKKVIDRLKQRISENNEILFIGLTCFAFNSILIAFISFMRGDGYIQNSLYHFYPIILFHIISLYALFCILSGIFKEQRKLYVLAIPILISGILLNSLRTYEINDLIRKKDDLFFRIQKTIGEYNMYQSTRIFLTYFENKHDDINKDRDYLNMALKVNPYSSFALIERGYLFIDQKNYRSAFNDFSKAISMSPDTSRAYTGRGLVYHRLGQEELAIRDFSTVITLNPRTSGPYNNRGRLFFELKQYDKALKDLSKAIKIAPANYMAYANRSLLYKEMGFDDLAEKDLKAASVIEIEE